MPNVRFVGGPYNGISILFTDSHDIQRQIDNRTSRSSASQVGHYICDEIPRIGYGVVGVRLEARWETDVDRPAAS